MLKCLRLLKPALICLYAAREIKCEMLSEDQWIVLEQIKINLKNCNVADNPGKGELPNRIIGCISNLCNLCALCKHSQQSSCSRVCEELDKERGSAIKLAN
jgi:hypothetical protein